MDSTRPVNRLISASGWIILAYALAFGAAAGAASLYAGKSHIAAAFAGDLAATAVVYVFGRIFRNSSFYDPYWSLAPLVIATYWTVTAVKKPGIGQFVILALIGLWGFRLTWHWARNWRGLGHEDWRYTELRRKSNGWYWLVELAGIDLMPTLVVFLGCFSVYPALTSHHDFGVTEVIAILFTSAAIVIESAADKQLSAFIKAPHTVSDIMKNGLWAYIRHPNYLGEIMFWWGLFLFGAVSGAGHWWMIAGPLTVTALFIFVSIPMMDRISSMFPRRPSIPANFWPGNYRRSCRVSINRERRRAG